MPSWFACPNLPALPHVPGRHGRGQACLLREAAHPECLRDARAAGRGARSGGSSISSGARPAFPRPCWRRAKSSREGRLGPIYYGKATYIRSRGIPAGIGGWFTEKARLGRRRADRSWRPCHRLRLVSHGQPRSPSAPPPGSFGTFAASHGGPCLRCGRMALTACSASRAAPSCISRSPGRRICPATVPEVRPWGRELRNTDLYGPKATLQTGTAGAVRRPRRNSGRHRLGTRRSGERIHAPDAEFPRCHRRRSRAAQ